MSERLVRSTAISSVLMVGAVAAVVSYAHIYDLALAHGEQWRAVLIPLAVDGMLVAATLAIVSQRRYRRPVGWVPWFGLSLGIVASLAANVAAAHPDVIARIVAGWPPVALAVSIETLVIILRSQHSPAPAPAPLERESESEPVTVTAELVEDPEDAELFARIREVVQEHIAKGQEPPGRRKIAEAVGTNDYRVRQLMPLVRRSLQEVK